LVHPLFYLPLHWFILGGIIHHHLLLDIMNLLMSMDTGNGFQDIGRKGGHPMVGKEFGCQVTGGM